MKTPTEWESIIGDAVSVEDVVQMIRREQHEATLNKVHELNMQEVDFSITQVWK